MNTLCRIAPILAGAAMLCECVLPAAETNPIAGTITQNKVNVRAQPALTGEIITQLKQGETVSVLETTTVDKPKPGEPARWHKIAMPANTPVWVHASFIDTNKAVAPAKLNVRAGPGENYSVVARLSKGQLVKEIRLVDDWMEIEAPASAVAYVASPFINMVGEGPILAEAKPAAPPTPKPEIKPEAKPEQVPPPTPAVETVKTEPPPPVVTETNPKPVEPAPVNPEIARNEATKVPAPTPAKPEPVVIEPPTADQTLVPTTPPPVAPPAKVEKRMVTREGTVRTTISPQAPTYYELRSLDDRHRLDYLFPTSTNMVLKPLRGKRVIVTGEELIDKRWPESPVLRIETLETVQNP